MPKDVIRSLFLLQERGIISNKDRGISKDRLSFPAECRIKKKKEFESIYSTGEKLFTKHFVVIVNRSSESESRIGITVSKKIDKRAVVRNKLKRRIREIFRVFRKKLKESFDIVIIARRDAPSCSFQEMRRQIVGTLRFNGLLQKR